MEEKKRIVIKNELHAYNEAAASLEKKCGRVKAADENNVCDLILHRLRLNKAFIPNETSGGFVYSKIIRAKYQADYVIALRPAERKMILFTLPILILQHYLVISAF